MKTKCSNEPTEHSRPTTPQFGTTTTTPSAYSKKKNWSRKLDCQEAIQNAKRVGKKFVLSRVEETWVVRLKNESILFKHVTSHNIFDNLGSKITVGKAINAIRLQQGMLSRWVEYPRVP